MTKTVSSTRVQEIEELDGIASNGSREDDQFVVLAEIADEVECVRSNIEVKLNRISMYRPIAKVEPLLKATIVGQTGMDECLIQIEEQCFLFANDPREL